MRKSQNAEFHFPRDKSFNSLNFKFSKLFQVTIDNPIRFLEDFHGTETKYYRELRNDQGQKRTTRSRAVTSQFNWSITSRFVWEKFV